MSKVTGVARYASDYAGSDDLHAVLVLADQARGTLTEINTETATALPGVEAVLTHREFQERVGPGTFLYDGGHFHTSFAPMAGPDIRYHGQLIALVVATTVEQARHAAALVTWTIEPVGATIDPSAAAPATDTEIFTFVSAPATPRPMANRAFGDDVTIDAEYGTPPMLHHPIEPYATRADWSSGRLVVASPSQWVVGEARGLAHALGVPVERVQVVSPVVGGAFGSRVLLLWHTVYVAEAARRLGSPVRLHVDRAQMATLGSYRAATQHRVQLSSTADGALQSYQHRVRSQTSRSDHLALPGTSLTARLYAIPSQRHRESVVPVDLTTPGFMRAPLEYPVAFALESALDELAAGCGIDPLELRLRNLHTGETAKANGTQGLRRCLQTGADRFSWPTRNPAVGSMHDTTTGEVLGWGLAVAHYPGYRGGLTRARVRLTTAGVLTVSLAAHDPGTGLASAVAVAVSRTLQIPLGRVTVDLGDSDLPLAPMAAGSASSATAVAAAVSAATRLLTLYGRDVLVVGPTRTIEAEATHIPDGYVEGEAAKALRGDFVQSGPEAASGFRFSVGAHFAEVGVDAHRGRIRVRRMLGVFDIGTVLHPGAARGQLESGLLWGIGHALMEDARPDDGVARLLATGIVDYHILSHADAPHVDVVLLDEDANDDPSNAKGAGEIGVVGSSAAITNAIFHATGYRVRSLPVRPQSVLHARETDMPPQS
ncbi:MAG: xanthine dehydrogenase family protein molybdopterin-binding subunit [Mycobacterium sp.]